MADAPHVAATRNGEVERCPQPVAVEAVQRGSGAAARQDVAADIDQHGSELGDRVGRCSRKSERVRADLDEGAARDPAPKLCVGDANAVRLPS
jgi:hypothetical protein